MIKTSETLRLRVFAGPNGSGKSTIINGVRGYRVNNQAIDFGIYINADDIAKDLRNNQFTFSAYEILATHAEFKKTALASGLINDSFSESKFLSSFFVLQKWY